MNLSHKRAPTIAALMLAFALLALGAAVVAVRSRAMGAHGGETAVGAETHQ